MRFGDIALSLTPLAGSFRLDPPCRRKGDFWPRNRVLARAGGVFPPISTLVEALAKEIPGRRRTVANAPTVFVPERGFVAKNERFRGIGACRDSRDVGIGGPRSAPSACALRDARGVGDGGLARRRSAASGAVPGRGRAQCRARHREPDRARHRSVAVSPPDVTLCDSIPVPMSRFHPDATLRPDIALYEDCVNYLRVTKGARQRIVNSWLQYPDVSRR